MASFSSLKYGFHSYTRTCLLLSRSLVLSMLPKNLAEVQGASTSQHCGSWKPSLLVEDAVLTLLPLRLSSSSTLLASLQYNLWMSISQGSVLGALFPWASPSSLGTLCIYLAPPMACGSSWARAQTCAQQQPELLQCQRQILTCWATRERRNFIRRKTGCGCK